ncbi:competence type IV pilus major pilin ComGC [Anaerorhabdus sp.]|uniref:competence type IV pilus major pilin ComGC n=1 Tax=Anaerorhabdus sp. TaxID=1872524 RepID=UPI002FCB9541
MNNRKKKGFTLIELIVVIAILAVLGLLIVPQISGYIDATQATTCQNNRKLVERAITVAEAKSGKTETFTTPEQVAAIKDSLYDGGKICPKEGTITITGHKVTCSIHKEETGGPTYDESTGKLVADQYDPTKDKGEWQQIQTNNKYALGDIVDFNGSKWLLIRDDNPSQPGNPASFGYWKKLDNTFDSSSRYLVNDIVTDGTNYYRCTTNTIIQTNSPTNTNYFEQVKLVDGKWVKV